MSKLTIRTGTEDGFFEQGRQLARAADRGEALPSESTISFEDPADRVKLMTPAAARRPRHSETAGHVRRNTRKRPDGDVTSFQD